MAHGIRDKPNNSTTSAHFTLQALAHSNSLFLTANLSERF